MIASHSIDRLKVIKNIVKNNKVKFLLLEKFLFLKKMITKRLRKFLIQNILVNVWGEIVFKILNLKKLRIENLLLRL